MQNSGPTLSNKKFKKEKTQLQFSQLKLKSPPQPAPISLAAKLFQHKLPSTTTIFFFQQLYFSKNIYYPEMSDTTGLRHRRAAIQSLNHKHLLLL